MNRIPRTVVPLALAATLLVATAPAAQARNLAKPQPSASVVVTGGWVDATLAWLGGFFVGSAPQGRAAQSMEKAIYPIPFPPPPVVRPMGCSTIDPNGATACGGGY